MHWREWDHSHGAPPKLSFGWTKEVTTTAWLRMHAATRTQVSAPLMTSVSHLATNARAPRCTRIGPIVARVGAKGTARREARVAARSPRARASSARRPVEELFDVERDPHQLRNLAEDPDYVPVMRRDAYRA